MKYRTEPTRLIHWDEEGMYKVDTSKDRIYTLRTGEIYKVYNNSLPIIIEGQIRIKNEFGIDVFSCILHTKVQLWFDYNENPINDLVKLMNETDQKEHDVWGKRIVATPLHGLFLENIESDPNSQLNTVCHIRDAARARGLIK